MSTDLPPELTPELLRIAYDQGVFPMAQGGADEAEIGWYRPLKRAVLLPDGFHVPKRLARLVRQGPFEIRWNDDFYQVMKECGSQRKEGNWINIPLLDAYTQWHEAGEAFCLSVFQDGIRVGGIYGPQRGGVFMAESMFSRVPNASSVALVVLVAGLFKAGVEMIDVQFENPHLTKFHPDLIPHKSYMQKLTQLKEKPVILSADYFCFDVASSLTQSLTQTS